MCYALTSHRDRSYVGYTVDPERRLRQHNGLIKGGARRTTRSASVAPWSFLFIVAVTHDAWGAHEALSLEWHLKVHRHTRKLRRPGESQSLLRLRMLQNALRLPKFAPFREHMTVFVQPALLDDAFALVCAQLPTPSIALLSIEHYARS
jgi:predicted GIY-YIG superfamily endonuclease